MTDGELASKGRPGNEKIIRDVVVLDYGTFTNKSFIECKLIYRGGRPPTLAECDFIDSEFILEGPALHTAQFLSALAHGGGEGAKEFVVQGLLGIGI